MHGSSHRSCYFNTHEVIKFRVYFSTGLACAQRDPIGEFLLELLVFPRLNMSPFQSLHVLNVMVLNVLKCF